jgi:dTDP-4-dehydrorhamnose reductase
MGGIFNPIVVHRGLIYMKILLLGGTGMVGSECKKVLREDHEIIAPDKKELDMISWDVVIENLQKISPDVILNCAGYADLDTCETEGFLVRKINVEGPRNLAQGSARFQSKLVHISSDYIFDGQKTLPQPYFEDDAPNPLSAYGKSKLESEVAVRENSPNYLIVRTGWLYSHLGENFVTSLLRGAVKKTGEPVRVPLDQFGSPTWAHRLAVQIKKLIEYGARGTYHATAEGYCNRMAWAEHIIEYLGLDVAPAACTLTELKHKAQRPLNCILENRHLKKQGLNIMRDWKEDVDAFLNQYGEQLLKDASKRT